MNKKKIISLLMVLVLILSMSPVLSVSARVNAKSFSFFVYPNRPQTSIRVTCYARLNNQTMTGSFSYYYPQSAHIGPPEGGYDRAMEFRACGRGAWDYRFTSDVDYLRLDVNFNPTDAYYDFYFGKGCVWGVNL